MLSKSTTAPHREVVRAKALLLTADGVANTPTQHTNTAIAKELGVSPASVTA